jgi:predicted nucleic acid-binding Zn ribbon protein
VRRAAPRPLRAALERAAERATPPGLLADVQAAWPDIAGPVVAQEAEPVSERDGVVTVACRSSVWAQELELLGRDLEERLNARLSGSGRVLRLRFRNRPLRHP